MRLVIKAWQEHQTERYCKAQENCRQVVIYRPSVRVDFGDEIEAEVPQGLSGLHKKHRTVRTTLCTNTAAPAQIYFHYESNLGW